jgi:hypothetical protein
MFLNKNFKFKIFKFSLFVFLLVFFDKDYSKKKTNNNSLGARKRSTNVVGRKRSASVGDRNINVGKGSISKGVNEKDKKISANVVAIKKNSDEINNQEEKIIEEAIGELKKANINLKNFKDYKKYFDGSVLAEKVKEKYKKEFGEDKYIKLSQEYFSAKKYFEGLYYKDLETEQAFLKKMKNSSDKSIQIYSYDSPGFFLYYLKGNANLPDSFLENNQEVVAYDNFCNKALRYIEKYESNNRVLISKLDGESYERKTIENNFKDLKEAIDIVKSLINKFNGSEEYQKQYFNIYNEIISNYIKV